MKFFKKDGKIKIRTVDSKDAKGLVEDGWYECDALGIDISKKSEKKEKPSKESK